MEQKFSKYPTAPADRTLPGYIKFSVPARSREYRAAGISAHGPERYFPVSKVIRPVGNYASQLSSISSYDFKLKRTVVPTVNILGPSLLVPPNANEMRVVGRVQPEDPEVPSTSFKPLINALKPLFDNTLRLNQQGGNGGPQQPGPAVEAEPAAQEVAVAAAVPDVAEEQVPINSRRSSASSSASNSTSSSASSSTSNLADVRNIFESQSSLPSPRNTPRRRSERIRKMQLNES
jgi:hypothetical protein